MRRLLLILSLLSIVILSACSERVQTRTTDIDETDIEETDIDGTDADGTDTDGTVTDGTETDETGTDNEKTGTEQADGQEDGDNTEAATSTDQNANTATTGLNDQNTDLETGIMMDEPDVIPVYEATDPEDGFSEGIWIKKYPGNNACFKLETPEGYQIVCDPYDINESLQPDIVTESHQDLDHVDTGSLTLPYDLLTEPGEYSYDEVLIKGYAGNHNKGNMSGINNIFVFSFDDITIAHFASQGALPEDEVLEQIGPVDVLMIQFFINPNYNKLTAADVEKIIEMLKPKIIIPEHCDASSAGWLATRMKLKEEPVTSGSLLVTRYMLDASDQPRIICLEQE